MPAIRLSRSGTAASRRAIPLAAGAPDAWTMAILERRKIMGANRAILVLVATGFAAGVSGDVVRTPVAAVPVSVNLRVASVRVERTGFTPAGQHQVRIDAQVICNAAAPTSVGPFLLLLEYHDGDGVYHRLGNATIPRLACGAGASARVPTETRTFTNIVPARTVRTFRATADSNNVIPETNDTDNWYATPYSANGCPGVDLVLTRLDLDRSRDGSSVLVQAWVRNRCLADCLGDIYYVIDPGAGGSVEQRIAIRIDGETEVGHLGTTAVAARPGEAVTYTVRIETRGGGCTDAAAGNNTCRVTLAAGVDARSFPCTASSAPR
jgi:hypothetical protein